MDEQINEQVPREQQPQEQPASPESKKKSWIVWIIAIVVIVVVVAGGYYFLTTETKKGECPVGDPDCPDVLVDKTAQEGAKSSDSRHQAIQIPLNVTHKENPTEEEKKNDAIRLKAVKFLGFNTTVNRLFYGSYPETPEGVLGKDTPCVVEARFSSDCSGGSSRDIIKDPSLEITDEKCTPQSSSLCNYTYKKIDEDSFEIYVYFETVTNKDTDTGLFVITKGTHNGLSPLPLVGPVDSRQDLKLISPNGGEILTKGKPFKVEWNATNYTRGIDIFLVKNGALVDDLNFVHGTESFLWDPVNPQRLNMETGDKIDISDADGYQILIHGQSDINLDMSDGTFSIVP